MGTLTTWSASRRTTLSVGIAAVAVLVLIGALWMHSRASASQTYQLVGAVSAPSCIQGYGLEHASVEVRDANNVLIGITSTGVDNTTSATCHVTFVVTLPKSAFYQFKVGSHQGPDYSFAQMQAKHWYVALNIDSN